MQRADASSGPHQLVTVVLASVTEKFRTSIKYCTRFVAILRAATRA